MTRDNDYYSKGQAGNYDALVSAQPSLLPVLQELTRLEGKRVLDLGAGTGRLTLEVLPHAASVTAVDSSASMLERLAQRAGSQGAERLRIVTADYGDSGLEDSGYDLILSGWALCYSVSSSRTGWESRLQRMISEIRRLAASGADIILLENYGTASLEPAPPDYLAPYLNSLEAEYGFAKRIVRLDYTFASVLEAADKMGAFFGPETAERIEEMGWSTVPEHAGVWHLRLS